MTIPEYEVKIAAMDAEIEQLLVDNIKLAGRIPDELVDDLHKAMERRKKVRMFLLKSKKGSRNYGGYDVASGFVVRASNERDARSIAHTDHGDEGKDTWLNEDYSSCDVLTSDGPFEIIIRDFNAG